MQPGDAEGGVPGINMIEQNFFKLIWANYVLFVVLPHRDDERSFNGPPATNYSYLQTV